jgi:hypothetical protein
MLGAHPLGEEKRRLQHERLPRLEQLPACLLERVA